MEQEHYKLVNDMNRELGEVKTELVNLNEKINENHSVHIKNREDIKSILEMAHSVDNKVGIQNGRVTKLEDTAKQLAIVASQNAGLIRTIQDSIGTNREVTIDELKKNYLQNLKRKEESTKAWFGIKYSVLERILWAIIGVTALYFKDILVFIHNLITK